MTVLILSKPDSSVANLLMQSGVGELVCVTEGDVYIRSERTGVMRGQNIPLPKSIELDIPKIKSELLKCYPLVDRWVSRHNSISSTMSVLLEYTVSLIQIIGNYPPRLAILETGVPHHLFTYCLDIALRYLRVDYYYLYGNIFDGRCVIFPGTSNQKPVVVTENASTRAVDDYIHDVRKKSDYVPEDSVDSLKPLKHRSIVWSLLLYARQLLSVYKRHFKEKSNRHQIRLQMPHIGLAEVASILWRHRKYLKHLHKYDSFDPVTVHQNDIVYVGHMLPEATSFPESPEYPDELDVLLDLKYRFPDANIYYREHPAIEIYSEFGQVHFQGLHKRDVFYRQLEKLDIGLIPTSLHISKLRERRCLFATKTGRVAIENSVLGLPTIVYGIPFYGMDLPLTFHVGQLSSGVTVDSLKEKAAAVEKPEKEVAQFLKARFYGSIENPGISLSPNPSAQAAFEDDVIKLLNILDERQLQKSS